MIFKSTFSHNDSEYTAAIRYCIPRAIIASRVTKHTRLTIGTVIAKTISIGHKISAPNYYACSQVTMCRIIILKSQ